LAELYRPTDPPAPELRLRSGTPNLIGSPHDDQAGKQQAPCKIKTKITSGRRATVQQRLERCDIALSYGDVAGPAPYDSARSGVINRGDEMAAKHDCRVVGDGLGVAELPEWADRRGTLVATSVLEQRLGELIKICTFDGVDQRCDDQLEILANLTRIRRIYSQRQRIAHCRIVHEASHRLVHDALREREAGPYMNPESEVGARAAEGRSGVKVSARQVEAVARPEQGLYQRRLLCPLLDRGLSIVPGLIAKR
jgi:hypothetical protein